MSFEPHDTGPHDTGPPRWSRPLPFLSEVVPTVGTMNEIVLTDRVDDADAEPISRGLDDFNLAQAGVADRTPLAVLVKDGATGRVQIGRASGRERV